MSYQRSENRSTRTPPSIDKIQIGSDELRHGLRNENRKTQAGAKYFIPPRRLPLGFQNSKPSMGFRWSSF